MLRTMFKSKIHRAVVTQSDLHYIGSLTVDEDLMEVADLLAGEQVSVVDITNGARLTTYVIPGERGSRTIGINGAAAHQVAVGDLVIVISYATMDDAEARSFVPAVVHVNAHNEVISIGSDPGEAVEGLVLDPGAVDPATLDQVPAPAGAVTSGALISDGQHD